MFCVYVLFIYNMQAVHVLEAREWYKDVLFTSPPYHLRVEPGAQNRLAGWSLRSKNLSGVVCVCMGASMHVCMYMTGYLWGMSFLLIPRGSLGSNWGLAWWQVPLPLESDVLIIIYYFRICLWRNFVNFFIDLYDKLISSLLQWPRNLTITTFMNLYISTTIFLMFL